MGYPWLDYILSWHAPSRAIVTAYVAENPTKRGRWGFYVIATGGGCVAESEDYSSRDAARDNLMAYLGL